MENILFKDHNIFYNVLCFLITENEKLFDRSDTKFYWRTVYKIFGIVHHAYVAIFAASLDLKSSPHVDLDNLYRFSAAYLTGWNFLFQTLFLTMSLTYDILEWMDRHDSKFGQLLAYYRDMFFSAVIVPLTFFISTMFWAIYWYDRELVFPRIYDDLVPWWFNHCVHTNILIVIILETLLQARRHPANLKMELGLVGLVVLAYAIVYYSIYFITKRWLYGIFAIMNWWQVCLYQIMICISHYIFYGIQFPVNRLFHSEQASQEVVQVTDDRSKGKKTRELTLGSGSGSWSLKLRSKSGCEDVCL